MLAFRQQSVKRHERLLQNWPKSSSSFHQEWQLQQTRHMNQAQRLRPHFLDLSQTQSDRTHDGLYVCGKFF